MVFNTIFNNISAISWRSVLLVEETGETTDLSQFTEKLYHKKWQNVVSNTPRLSLIIIIRSILHRYLKYIVKTIKKKCFMLFLSLLQLTAQQIKRPALIQVRVINTSRIANYQCELYCIFRNPTPRNKTLLIDWLIDWLSFNVNSWTLSVEIFVV